MMAELRRDPNQAFWEIVESNDLASIPMDELGVTEASYDPDLTAVCELKVLGETDSVNPQRANLIEMMIGKQKGEEDYLQLLAEIQRKFALTGEEMQRSIELCMQRAITKKNEDIEWMEP